MRADAAAPCVLPPPRATPMLATMAHTPLLSLFVAASWVPHVSQGKALLVLSFLKTGTGS